MKRWKLPPWLTAAFSRDSLAPERVATREQWIEILLLPLGAALLGWLASPQDPTLSQQGFPWQWLAPVLVALRYGVWPGLLASAVLLANGWVAAQLGRVPAELSTAPLFGGGLMVLICGEFSDVWHDRNRRMEETYLYVTERLSRLTKRHLLLNFSHDRLEQEMLARPGSLRDALVSLRSATLEPAPEGQALAGAQGLLQLLSQYINMEAATLYTLREHQGDYVLGELVAQLGEPEALAPDDALLALALESGSLAHVATEDAGLDRRSNQLVVAPLVAGDDTLIGVLAVTRMPFFSLSVENLQMLLVLLGYYADNLGSARGIQPILQQVPAMPFLFAQELARMGNLHRKIGMDSQLVVMRFHGARGGEMADAFLRIKRGLDLYWKTFVGELPVLVVLLPFASSSAADGFTERLEAWLKIHFYGDFAGLGVSVQVIGLDASTPVEQLKKAMTAP